MMEVEYGVGITNRFAYLYGSVDKEEEEEVVPVAKKGPKAKVAAGPPPPQPKAKKLAAVVKTSKPEEKPAVKTTSAVSAENKINSAKNRNQGQQQQGPGGDKLGGPKRAAEGFGDNKKVGAGGDSNEANLSRPKSGTRVFRNSGSGPPAGGRSNNYGRFDRDGRDKADGQKQSSEMKTGAKTNAAGGTANQKGPSSDEGKDDKENVKEGEENQEKSGQEKEGGEENPEGTETQKEEPPVPTFTLREWKSLQAPREKPQYNIRKPGEGEDKLVKLVPMKKEDELKEPESDEFDVDEVYYPQRAGKQKRIEDVGFTTGYQRQRRGGPGGRTEGRGGGGGRGRSGEGNERGRSGEGNEHRRAGDGDGRSPPNPEKKMDQEPDRMSNKPRGGRTGFGQGHRRSAPVVQAPKIDDTSAFPTLG